MHIISEYFHIFECLKNNDSRKYKVKLIISSRPHTLRYLNTKEAYKRKLEAYGISKELSINSPPDISKIFNYRFKYATEITTKNGELIIKDTSSWKSALKILITIAKEIDLDFGKILYQINHYNIRETLTCFIKILCNRKWLQKGQIADASFILNYDDFNTTKSSILKALIYGNNAVYINNERVPNILFTDYEHSYELYSLLIIQYYIKKRALDNYGIINTDISLFLKSCDNLWNDSEITEKLIICINDLIAKKILLYSVYEKEYEDKNIKIGTQRKLYISAKGIAIWKMLNNDSLLFEAYREDVYRESNNIIHNNSNASLTQEEILIDCLYYLENLVNQEINIKKMFINENKDDLYNELFGSTLVTQNIFTGIVNTINYYFKAHNRRLSTDFEEIFERIKKIYKQILP